MRKAIHFSILCVVSLVAFMGRSNAGEWSASGELEYFRWRESTTPAVIETGPRVGVGLTWTQDRESGWLAAYSGRLYRGSVDYEGSLLFSGAPATGTTQYRGIVNELQAIHRSAGTGRVSLEYVAGLGLDYWKRSFSAVQSEAYSVVFLRLGVNVKGKSERGWFGGGGIKYPLYVREEARLSQIGFDQDAALRPRGELSPYARLGYRFSRQWSIAGYYEGYRFARSNSVRVTSSSPFPHNVFNVFQPPSRMDMLGLSLRYDY